MGYLNLPRSAAARLAAVAMVLGLLGGCALTAQQKTAVAGFGSAAHVLGDVSTAELAAIREDTIRMNNERLLLEGVSKDTRLADQKHLDLGFELAKVETIGGATRALAAYGKMLSALATDTQGAEIQAASLQFAASVGSLPGMADKLSGEKLGLIGTAVSSIGSTFADYKRKQAVTVIVNNAKEAVDALCDLLIRDFAVGENPGFVSLHLASVEYPLMSAANVAFSRGSSYGERRVALDAFRLAHGNRVRRTDILQRVVNAALAMKKANNAVARAVNDPVLSLADIQDFVQKSRTLQAAVKAAATPTGEQHA